MVVPVWDLPSTVQGKGFPLCVLRGGVVESWEVGVQPSPGNPRERSCVCCYRQLSPYGWAPGGAWRRSS